MAHCPIVGCNNKQANNNEVTLICPKIYKDERVD